MLYKITVFSALAVCSVTSAGIGSFVRYLLFCNPLLWLNPAGSKTSQPLPPFSGMGERSRKKKSKICRLRWRWFNRTEKEGRKIYKASDARTVLEQGPWPAFPSVFPQFIPVPVIPAWNIPQARSAVLARSLPAPWAAPHCQSTGNSPVLDWREALLSTNHTIPVLSVSLAP